MSQGRTLFVLAEKQSHIDNQIANHRHADQRLQHERKINGDNGCDIVC